MADAFPDKFSDLPISEYANKLTGTDVDGKHYTAEESYNDPGLRQVMKGNTTKVYDSVSGGYTADPGYAIGETSVSIDKNTGKITIKAPQSLIDSSLFKNYFGSDASVLKQYSKAYKTDHNYKVPYQNDDGSETEITIPELVAKLDEGIKKIGEDYKNILSAKKSLAQSNEGADNFNIEQVIMATSAPINRGDVKASDSDRLIIPDNFFDFSLASGKTKTSDIKKLKSFSEVNGAMSVERGDFLKNWYNLDHLTTDDMRAIQGHLATTLKMGNWDKDSDYYTAENELSGEEYQEYSKIGITEMAKTIAFLTFIQNEDPSGNFFQKAGLVTESFVTHFAMGATKAYTGTMSAIESAAGFVTNNLDNWTTFSTLDQDIKLADDYYGEGMALVNDAANAVSWIEAVGYLAGMKAMGTAASMVGTGVGKVAGAVSDKIIDATTATVAGDALETTTNIAVGNFVKAGSIGSEIVGEAKALGNIATLATQSANIAKGASFLVNTLNATGKIGEVFSKVASISSKIKNTPFVGTSIDFLLDTIRDAAITDPASVRTLLKGVRDGSVSQKDIDFAKDQLNQNAIAWAVFGAASKGLQFSAKTTVGKAMNLKISQWISKVDSWAGDKDEAFKKAIFGKSTIEKLSEHLDELTENTAAYRRVASKLQQAEQKELLRSMKKTFASGDWDTTLKNIEKLSGQEVGKDLKGLKKWVAEGQAVQNQIRAINNMIDHSKSYVMHKTAEMADPNREFFTGMTNRNITEWDAKLSDIEARVGDLTYDAKHTMMSVESANYMGLKMAEEHAAIISEMDGAVGQAAAKRELPKIQSRLAELSDNLPSELKSTLDNGIKLYRKEYAALSEYQKAYALTNIVSRKELEDLDLWDEGYVRTRRVTEDTGARFTTETGERVGRVETTEKMYVFDAGKDYQDFEQVRTSYRTQIAQAQYSKDLAQTYLVNGNATKKTVISAEQTEYVRKMTAAKTHYYNEMQTAANQVSVDMNVSGKVKAPAKMSKAEIDITVSGIDYTSGQEILEGMGYKNGSLVDDVRNVDQNQFTAKEKAIEWRNFKSNLNKNAITYLESKGIDSIEKLQDALKSGTDFEAGLNRAFLRGDNDFLKSDTLREIRSNADTGRMDFLKSSKLSIVKKNMQDFEGKVKKPVSNIVDGAADWSNNYIDEFTNKATESFSGKTIGETLGTDLGEDAGLVSQHAALSALSKDKKTAYDMLDTQVKKELKNVALTDEERVLFYQNMHDTFDATLESKISNLEAQFSESNIDYLRGDIFTKVKSLNDEITQAETAIKAGVQSKGVKQSCLIEALDENGATVFYEVDPALAGLYNRRMNLTTSEAGQLARFNYALSKTFRLGTTTANLTSFGNQFFKDSIDGIVVGGMWDTFKANAENFRDVFGDSVVDQLNEFNEYELKQVMAQAQAEGISVNDTLLKRETARAANIASESAEYTAYKEFRKMVYEGKEGKLPIGKRMTNAVQKAEEKIDDIMNGYRENYIRKNVYMSNMNKALNDGYSINQARTFAEFTERNATTNFGRSLYHLQSISESTPYFTAAINGTKSFWRMFELDPVGITGRFMGGLVLPVMYFTANNLANEENRKVYENLAEYQKEGNIIFMVNGQIQTIPLPEQLTSLVAPFRQFVEHTYHADKYTFWQLAQNDLLGLSPIDLQGFSEVDMDRMSYEGGNIPIEARLGRGVARVFSQAAPVPLKTAYMLATQTDPYTGKQIRNADYYYDEETGTIQKMDYTSNQFAKNMARFFGSDNAAIIEKVTSGIIGNTGTDILGFLWGIGTVVGDSKMTDDELALENRKRFTMEDYAEDAASTIAGRITKPFTEEAYDQTNAAWRREVNRLQGVKEQLLNDPIVQNINTKLNQESDPEERKKLLAQRQNYVDKFAEQVKTAANNLVNTYGGTIDRHKYAAVIALLNFNSDAVWASGSQYSLDLANSTFYDSRSQAIRTMEQLGVNGTTDGSVFGYLYTDRNTGETKVKYSLPSTIVDAQNTWYSAAEQNLTNVTTLIKNAGLKDQRTAMWAQLKAVDSKDYDGKDKIRDSWNEKVLGTIMPYIQTMTPEAVLKDENMINYLEQWIEVPSYWEKVNNRYISSGYDEKTGTYKVDKNRAFIESYLKKILL